MLKNSETENNVMPRKPKRKISVSIDQGLLEWIDSEIDKFTFQSISHAIEQAVLKLKMEMEQKKQKGGEGRLA